MVIAVIASLCRLKQHNASAFVCSVSAPLDVGGRKLPSNPGQQDRTWADDTRWAAVVGKTTMSTRMSTPTSATIRSWAAVRPKPGSIEVGEAVKERGTVFPGWSQRS